MSWNPVYLEMVLQTTTVREGFRTWWDCAWNISGLDCSRHYVEKANLLESGRGKSVLTEAKEVEAMHYKTNVHTFFF